MKEWRERNPPGSSNTTSPSAAMSTPSKQRNRGTNEPGSARASGTKRSNAASKATATDVTMAGMDRDEDDSEDEDSYGGGAPVKTKPNAKTKGKEPAKKRRRGSEPMGKAAPGHEDLMSVPMYPGFIVDDSDEVEIWAHQPANGKRAKSADIKTEETAPKMKPEDEGEEVVFQRERRSVECPTVLHSDPVMRLEDGEADWVMTSSCTVKPKPEDEI